MNITILTVDSSEWWSRVGLYADGELVMDDNVASRYRVAQPIQARIEGYLEGVDMVCENHPDGYSYTLAKLCYVGPVDLSEHMVFNGLPRYLNEIREEFLELN